MMARSGARSVRRAESGPTHEESVAEEEPVPQHVDERGQPGTRSPHELSTTRAIKREVAQASQSATSAGAKQVLDFWANAIGASAPAKPRPRPRPRGER
jgi:hypothetical protein